jgi:Tol biopolymer transport system component
MPLAVGSLFSHYEVLSAVGSGGMGRVYRARDIDLHRDVALKVLLPEVSSDPERLARLVREAQVLASLNHPNIAGIYALEHGQGVHALVMEFVEGPTLLERIRFSALPVEEALPIAKQIADALCVAHEQGIIHRDLKPANVKVRPDGTVKVLDFGLAKALDPRMSEDPTKSPTLSWHSTGAGVILGTASYMSPEQAAGRNVDRRTDLWSFGVVLLEMLTGQPAFPGETVSHVLAAVLRAEPDWTTLPKDTPLSIRRLLRRCLRKDPKQRLADAGDARLEIEEVIAGVEDEPRRQGSRWLRWLPWAVAAALAVALVTLMLTRVSVSRGPSSAIGVEARLGAEVPLLTSTPGSAIALAPDGSAIVFVTENEPGRRQLFVRHLSGFTAQPIAGTAGAESPFFSPDGRWIAFFAEGKLKKVLLDGGAAVTICDAPNGRGGDWGEDQQIIFQPNLTGPLMRVSSGGGTAAPLTKLVGPEVTQRWPQSLNGGRVVLYTSNSSRSNWEGADIVIETLSTGTRTVVQQGGYYGRFIPTGHLVYVHQGLIFAKGLDLSRPNASSSPLPVVQKVLGGTGSGAAHLTIAADGTLAYVPQSGADAHLPLVWMDRRGEVTPLWSSQIDFRNPELSPDGRRVALSIGDGEQFDIWVGDASAKAGSGVSTALAQAGAMTGPSRLTFDPADDFKPVWTPDGRAIVYSSARAGALNLYVQLADGGRPAERLTESPNSQVAGSFHPEGKFLAFQENRPDTGQDILIAPIASRESSPWSLGTPIPFVATPASEVEPVFSPDGRWVAYVSNASGRDEVYVRPFATSDNVWQVSAGGGTTPTWAKGADQLVYRAPSGLLMVVNVTTAEGSFRVDTPQPWAPLAVPQRRGQRAFDLHPDGQRVVIGSPDRRDERGRDHISFVFGFFERVRQVEN